MAQLTDKAAEAIMQLEKIQDFLHHNKSIVEEFKQILELAKDTCDKPISIISFSTDGSHWLNSSPEISFELNEKELAFCRSAVITEELVIMENVANSCTSLRLFNIEKTQMCFYAGAALTTTSGVNVGALCLIDTKPSQINQIQLRLMQSLAKQIMYIIESRIAEKELNERLIELEEKNQALRAIAQLQSHEIRQPFSSILGLLNLAEMDAVVMDKTWLKMTIDVAKILDTKIRSVVSEAMGETDIKLFRYNNMVGEIEDYAILLLDTQGNVENWNKGAEKIKGYKASEIVGRNFSVFYNEQQRKENLPQQMLETARKHGVARDEGYRTRKDKTQFMARVVITAVHNQRKEIVGFTKVTRDISNEKPPLKFSA